MYWFSCTAMPRNWHIELKETAGFLQFCAEPTYPEGHNILRSAIKDEAQRSLKRYDQVLKPHYLDAVLYHSLQARLNSTCTNPKQVRQVTSQCFSSC